MGYGDLKNGQGANVIADSPLESAASGFKVGRLTVWPSGSLGGAAAAEMILTSGNDITIIRCPTQDADFGRQILRPDLACWQADTLMYFEVTPSTHFYSGPRIVVRELGASDTTLADDLIGDVFADYRNHYSTNPLLSAIDITTAYRDWTRHCLARPDHVVLVGWVDGSPAGIFVVDQSNQEYQEVLLAGIVPRMRRAGWYQAMMSHVVRRAELLDAAVLAISTQASNVSVMRAWCRMGFLPTISANTFHACRAELLSS